MSENSPEIGATGGASESSGPPPAPPTPPSPPQPPAAPAPSEASPTSAEQQQAASQPAQSQPTDSHSAGSQSAGSQPADSRSAESPKPKRKKRRRRRSRGGPGEERPPAPRQRRPRGRGQGGNPSQHHASTAIRSLSQMAQGLLEVEGIDFLSRPRFIDIEVRVPLDAGRDGAKSAGEVIERILRRVKEVKDHDRALVPGAVYSYRTDSAEEEACRPKEAREVFDGYTSTGRPNFTDFVTMAIERKDQGIDELLAGEDVVITHIAMGRVLRTAQLAEFGKASPIYRILGQVDAGLFPLTNSAKRAAFSFQVLRGTTLEGRPRLRVHPVGAADVLDLADPAVPAILSKFQHRLDQESLRLAGALSNAGEGKADFDEEEFVLPLLQELAKQLEGRARRKNRRTKHADQRSQEGQRPTAKAYEDARSANDDQLLWDDRENTAVVLGPRGRVHVFTARAKHVTSLVMQGSAVNRRRQQRQWRAAEPEERGEFRMALKRVSTQAVEEDEPAPEAAATPPPVAPTPPPVAPPPTAPPVAASPPATPPAEPPAEPPPADSAEAGNQSGDGDEVDHGA